MQISISADNVTIGYKGFTLRPRRRLREIALLIGDINEALVNTVAESAIAAALELIEVPDDLGSLE